MKYITAIDLGSQSIKGAIAKVGGRDLQVLAIAEQPSEGIRRGVVVHIEEAANAIAKVLETLSNISGIRPREVYVGFGDPQISVRETRGTVIVSRADQEISEEDVTRVFQAAEMAHVPQNKEVLHLIPREFIVDGEGGVKDPVGMKGLKLEVRALLIEGFLPFIKNLQKAFELCGIEVRGMVFAPLAASRAVLGKRQRELGSLMIDIGGTTTGLVVYEDGEIVHAHVLPIGSSHITNDIAINFKLQFDMAEKLKLEYGASLPSLISKKEMVNFEEMGIDLQNISRRSLSEIINRRIKDILKHVQKELKNVDRHAKFPGGIILTGGGARLPLIVDLIKKEMKLPAQIGFPEGVTGLIEKFDDPRLAGITGLLLWASDFREGDYKRGVAAHDFTGGMTHFVKKLIKNILP